MWRFLLRSLRSVGSVEHAALVGGNHVLDVDECVFSTVDFEALQSLLDQISEVLALPLAVVDLVAKVDVFGLHQVQNWQDLSVVGHQSLTNCVGALNEPLQDLESDGDNLRVTGVQSN